MAAGQGSHVVLPSMCLAVPTQAQQRGEAHVTLAPGRLDLHTHSTFSDGTCSVPQLIDEAREQGLSGLAVTDHDTLAHLQEIRALSREVGFPVLAGLEVSTKNPVTGRKVHVLAYNLVPTADESTPVERVCRYTRTERAANTLWLAWQVMHTGYSYQGRTITVNDVIAAAGPSATLYKQHIMEALTHLSKHDPDYDRIFHELFSTKDGLFRRSVGYPDTMEAIRAIRESGGVPVLAHPGQMDSWSAVPDMVGAGLMGIEAYHHAHTPKHVRMAHELAAQYGLFVTGGSDYNGLWGVPTRIGQYGISVEEAGQPVADLFERDAALCPDAGPAAGESLVDVAVDFMGEYADVFEELSR